jgi:hypothetical protein
MVGMKPDVITRKEREMNSANVHSVEEPKIPIKVGTVFRYSWGYGQTNVNWFEAVRVSEKSVWIREIAAEVKETGMMCGESKPVRGKFIGPEMRKNIRYYDNAPSLSMPHGVCRYWGDGEVAAYVSWYY